MNPFPYVVAAFLSWLKPALNVDCPLILPVLPILFAFRGVVKFEDGLVDPER